ncbi:hypothetical protein [Hyphomonas sp.]|uniref:hypothetical protein n=1 Tax=Hyphomonas sp. TaxID=87 RepID=UPI000C905679|nr:hypothetical protein [Hyphomonas sp.]MAL42716.1 hypothetical protein [Hyphomonas sp.]
MPYIGKTPSQATRKRYYKTASGSETSISGTMTVGGTLTFNDGEFVDVSVNGVALVAGTDYNTNTANTIAGLSALSANDQVEIVVYDTFSVFGGNVDGDFNLNNGTMTLTRDDNEPQLIIKSTDADASSGPEIELFRDSASPADSDAVGQIQFKGKNDAAEEILYGEIDAFIRDASDGTEDGEVRINVMRGGTSREALSLGQSDVVFNEGSEDVDVRMESDGNTHMFFLDGGNNTVGIGTDSATNPLTVRGAGGTGATAAIRWRDESNQGATLGVFNSGNVVLNAEQGNFFLNFNTTGKFTFESGGDLDIVDGNLKVASGHGIDFSATANSSGTNEGELLDDYEVGQFTPVGATTSGNAASFSSVSGRYQKIGRMVTVYGFVTNINTSGTTSSAQFRIGGLPFTPDVADCHGVCVYDTVTLQGGRTQIVVRADASSDALQFMQQGSGLGETATDHGDITSGTTDIFFQVTYQTSQ